MKRKAEGQASHEASRAKCPPTNEYTGWRISGEIERISFDISPSAFYDRYIKARRPVVLLPTTTSSDDSWRRDFSRWTTPYIREQAGDSTVRVEVRGDGGAFGRGRTKSLLLRDFIDSIERGEESLYLTTQKLDVDEEGRPDLMSPPCTQLFRSGDFPLVPPIMGNLVPMNVNLWWGNSRAGSSSGLHHDYHDNLYVLLKGSKRFRLFSPADSLRLRTQGEIATVHPNGRISYAGLPTHADGSDEAARRAMAAALELAAAEAEVEEARNAGGADGADGARLEAAEKRLENALEAVLDVECSAAGAAGGADEDEDDEDDVGGGGGDDDGGEDDEAGEDEEDEDDADFGGDDGDEDDDDDDDGNEDEEDAVDGVIGEEESDPGDASGAGEADRPGKVGEGGVRLKAEAAGAAGRRLPDNFSLVDPGDWAAAVASSPALAEATFTDVTLRPGEVLYLPCGWFHEVVSRSEPAPTEPAPTEQAPGAPPPGAETPGHSEHQAFNYWFHPPDGTDFEAPYTSGFWAWDFSQRTRPS